MKAQCKATFRCPNPILVIVLVIVRIVIVLVFVLVIVRIMMIAQQTGRGTLGGWKNRAITGTRVTKGSRQKLLNRFFLLRVFQVQKLFFFALFHAFLALFGPLYGLLGPFLTLFNEKNIIFSPFRKKFPGKA